MPDPPTDPRRFGREFDEPMRPPPGFEAQKFPLRHNFFYSAGLSALTTTKNSTMFPIVRYYKGTVEPDTLEVNPKHDDFTLETGPVCTMDSIIDRIKISLHFSITKAAVTTDGYSGIRGWWMPIFFSFPEKLDAADEKTTSTVAALLTLTKDATQEDVTPTYSTKLPTVGSSDALYPLSTANLAATITTENLTTDATMESVAFNSNTFFDALKYYTNKGALKACIGKIRRFTLTPNHRNMSFHIRKRAPRSIRRIMPYAFMAILVHIPTMDKQEQLYQSTAGTADTPHIGVKCLVRYHEWNASHLQEISAT